MGFSSWIVSRYTNSRREMLREDATEADFGQNDLTRKKKNLPAGTQSSPMENRIPEARFGMEIHNDTHYALAFGEEE